MSVSESALGWRAPERKILWLIVNERIGFPKCIVSVAGPGIVLGGSNHAGANRIQVSVPHDREDVAPASTGLNHRRLQSLRYDLASPERLLAVEPTGKQVVDHLPETTELSLALCGDHNHMRVRPHQAVRTYENAVPAGVLPEEREKERLRRDRLEDLGGVVATPSAVIRGAEIDEE